MTSPPPADDADTSAAAPPRTRGPYAKGVARRREILDRAIEVFAQRGAEGTSLRAIAREIGVSHAALTHYFASREDLLVEVYREAERQVNERESDTGDITAAESMAASAYRNHAVPGLVQLYSSLVASALEPGHPEATAFATERFTRVRRNVTAHVRRDQRAGRVRADLDPAAVATLIIAASDGLQTQHLLDASAPQTEAHALLVDLLTPRD
ncbi:TetR/AcrR family transcriptional regulator [Microbacterium koreense]|uniref:TetR/AcrR family transcriptional regulator n=1 Tax=Microbacterium koreense TaxID=323761 RepID=A0ABW2ZMQ0_9MICO